MNIEPSALFSVLPFGERATDSIAHFFPPLDCVTPPTNVKLASSSCLAKGAKKCTLEPVQLRILG